jgi:putative transposase
MLNTPHRKTVRKFNTAGHAHFLTFSCYRRMKLLTNDTWRMWLAESLRKACAAYEFALWAYVFMPEHVHLLLKPRRANYSLPEFEKAVKLSSSKKIVNHLHKTDAELLKSLRVRERPGKWCHRFWQQGGGHDKNLWSLAAVVEKAKYCHNNPVKRRLADDPAKWKWSSFRWLELGSRADEPLVVDDWDETLIEESSAG